jgi:hypothetical protein
MKNSCCAALIERALFTLTITRNPGVMGAIVRTFSLRFFEFADVAALERRGMVA